MRPQIRRREVQIHPSLGCSMWISKDASPSNVTLPLHQGLHQQMIWTAISSHKVTSDHHHGPIQIMLSTMTSKRGAFRSCTTYEPVGSACLEEDWSNCTKKVCWTPFVLSVLKVIRLNWCQGEVDFMRPEWILSATCFIGVLALLGIMRVRSKLVLDPFMGSQ
jgi:hypothetical protein